MGVINLALHSHTLLILKVTLPDNQQLVYSARRMETLDPYIAKLPIGSKWELIEHLNGNYQSIADNFWDEQEGE